MHFEWSTSGMKHENNIAILLSSSYDNSDIHASYTVHHSVKTENKNFIIEIKRVLRVFIAR